MWLSKLTINGGSFRSSFIRAFDSRRRRTLTGTCNGIRDHSNRRPLAFSSVPEVTGIKRKQYCKNDFHLIFLVFDCAILVAINISNFWSSVLVRPSNLRKRATVFASLPFEPQPLSVSATLITGGLSDPS